MHKLPRSKKPKRSHFPSEKAWVDACYKHGTKCGLQAQEYIINRDERRVRKSCQKTQRRAQKLQGTPLSANRALCPIVIPLNIIPGPKPSPEMIVNV